MGEALSDPRAGSIASLPSVVEAIVTKLAAQTPVLREVIRLGKKDYSTTVHSINVMALTLNYCIYE